ncbi:MAG: hypothetical protein IPM77_02090 [Crocinitomicaceae bacterium]|nr:hypothetical protein [Crocinitomicaceae bacterium]
MFVRSDKYPKNCGLAQDGYPAQHTSVYLPKELLPTGEDDIYGNPVMGCYNIEADKFEPYKQNYPGYVQQIYIWQNEMCRYIKDSLQHSNHPLAVSYSGLRILKTVIFLIIQNLLMSTRTTIREELLINGVIMWIRLHQSAIGKPLCSVNLARR